MSNIKKIFFDVISLIILVFIFYCFVSLNDYTLYRSPRFIICFSISFVLHIGYALVFNILSKNKNKFVNFLQNFVLYIIIILLSGVVLWLFDITY